MQLDVEININEEFKVLTFTGGYLKNKNKQKNPRGFLI